MSPKTLSSIETLALAKAIKDKARDAARDTLCEGAHTVDFTARISGTLLIAPQQPDVKKEDVEPRRLIALLLEKLQPRVRAQLVRFIESETADWRSFETEDQPRAIGELLPIADYLLQLAHREKAGTKRGNVTAPLSVELVKRSA